METDEIREFFRKKLPNKNVFVLALDQLATKVSLPIGIVLNLSPSTEGGSHWVGIYINDLGHCTYFCSYGEKAQNKEILWFLKMNSKSVHYNIKQIQSPTSIVCGLYAVAFIYAAFSGITLVSFLRPFTFNFKLNDVIIRRMFERYDKYLN